MIDAERPGTDACIVGRSRPEPVLGLSTQTTTNGIAMHVLNLLVYGGRFVDVAILAAAPLPKAVMHVGMGLAIFHPD